MTSELEDLKRRAFARDGAGLTTTEAERMRELLPPARTVPAAVVAEISEFTPAVDNLPPQSADAWGRRAVFAGLGAALAGAVVFGIAQLMPENQPQSVLVAEFSGTVKEGTGTYSRSFDASNDSNLALQHVPAEYLGDIEYGTYDGFSFNGFVSAFDENTPVVCIEIAGESGIGTSCIVWGEGARSVSFDISADSSAFSYVTHEGFATALDGDFVRIEIVDPLYIKIYRVAQGG